MKNFTGDGAKKGVGVLMKGEHQYKNMDKKQEAPRLNPLHLNYNRKMAQDDD